MHRAFFVIKVDFRSLSDRFSTLMAKAVGA
jgi:hypothetical protein